VTSILGKATLPLSRDGEPKQTGFLPTPIRIRRPLIAIASTVVVLASVAGFANLYARANRQSPVVIVTHQVVQGQQISEGDLGVVDAAISGTVSTVPVGDVDLVAGKRAAVTLLPGSLLSMSDVSSSLQILPGHAVVGIALKAGQLPSSGLQVGERVMVVQTASSGSLAGGVATTSPAASNSAQSGYSAMANGVLVPAASVYAMAIPSANSGSDDAELVSIQVSSALAPAVSVVAAEGQVSLILLPQEGPS
jgi:hypothetical protein